MTPILETKSRRALLSGFLCILASTISAVAKDQRGDHPEATTPLTPQEQLAKFHVPPGFEVQLVAAEPEIQKPVNITFDSAGRLWVTGSEMYPWPAGTDAQGNAIPGFEKAFQEIATAFRAGDKAPKPSFTARDTVHVLSDFAPDGHAQKISVFADGLNIPSGIQPLPRKRGAKGDTVIVYSIPYIWRLEDTDGDGKADKREPLYGPFGYLDTHGGSSSYLYWLDGWIYGTHGFRNHSNVKDRNGKVVTLDSGSTYRFKADGSAFEYYTHGQTNPFGLTVDPLGNFYSADSHSKPVYMLLPGAYYEGISKLHDGLGFAPRITDDDHGSSAIAGIAYYADNKWPEEFRGNLFNGNPVTQKINRDRLEWHGSTPKAIRMTDFVSCDDEWFRPVQVKLGPDGALYIADFYNPIIGHYEAPLTDPRRDHAHARIWRVVYRGEKKDAPVATLPDLSKLDAKSLVEKLADPNLIVRTLATNELADRLGKDAVESLTKGAAQKPSDAERAHSLWALGRLGALNNELLETASKDPSPLVRAQVPQLFHFPPHNDAKLFASLSAVAAQQDSDAGVRRMNARNLAGGQAANMGSLLEMWKVAAPEDLELIYTIRMDLRDALMNKDAYVVAQNMAKGSETNAKRLADVSIGVLTPDAASFLLKYLEDTKFAAPRTGEIVRHIATHLPRERLSELVTLVAQFKDTPVTQQLDFAAGLAEAGRQPGVTLPDELAAWNRRVLVGALAGRDKEVDRAIAAVSAEKFDEKYEPLHKIFADHKNKPARRQAALTALANLPRASDLLLTILKDNSDLGMRTKAAGLLVDKVVEPGVADAMLDALPTAPAGLAATLVLGLGKSDASAARVLDLIEAGKVSPTVLRGIFTAYVFAERAKPLSARYDKLVKDLPSEDARLNYAIAIRANGYSKSNPDPKHGAQVFQVACAACHRFRNEGGNVGPNLDGVSARAVHRLCEDIIDPNRNVDPTFRVTTLTLDDGTQMTGLIQREEGGTLFVRDIAGQETPIPQTRVKERVQSNLSLMPPGLNEALTGPDFNDLLSYLLTPAGK